MTTRARTALLLAAVTVGLVLASVFYTVPMGSPCGSYIPGGPGDATTGGVWMAWAFDTHAGPPWEATTEWSGAPFGERFWEPHYNTMLTVWTPMWLLSKAGVSATCTYTLMVQGGFVLSALAMFALAWFLTRNGWASSFAAFAYAFSPFRQYKAQGHLNYVHAEFLVLMVLASLLVWQRPSRGRVVFLGATVALAGYTDGYYLLIGGAAFAGMHLAALAWARWGARWSWAEVRARAFGVVAAGAIGVVLMIPLLITFLNERSKLSSNLLRSSTDAQVFSARPQYFFLPPRTHPWLDTVFGPFSDRHLTPGSNYSEATLYVGWTVLALVGLLAVWLVAARRRRSSVVFVEGQPMGLAVAMLVGLAAVSLVMSAPPDNHLGSLAVPAPSKVVFELITFWRVFARFFITLHAAAVVLAALGLALLVRRRRQWVQGAVAVACIGLVAFEFLTFPPRGWFDYEDGPGVYEWLADQRDVDTVAEYPLFTWEQQLNRDYLTGQVVHEKRLLNARVTGSVADGVGRAVYGLGDPGTPAALRRLGVDLVVVHPSLAGDPADADRPLPDDYEKVASFRFEDEARRDGGVARRVGQRALYDADVYRIRPGPVAPVVVSLGGGFLPSEPLGWESRRWMRARAELELIDFSPGSSSASVGFVATTQDEAVHELVATQSGRELWRGPVSRATEVRFVAAADAPVELAASGFPNADALALYVARLSAS